MTRLALAFMAFVLGVGLGYSYSTRQHQAQAVHNAQAASARYQAQLDEAAATADTLREQLRAQNTYTTHLAERARHAPLFAPTAADAACTVAAAPGSVWPGAAAGGDGPAGPGLVHGPSLRHGDVAGVTGVDGAAALATRAPAAAGPGDGPGLSLAAVSVWNSALAGADMPAGTCGPSETATAACAAAAGVTLAQAWANHLVNASSCADDRARLGALVDLISRRQAHTPTHTQTTGARP